MKFAFIGGTVRGHKLLEELIRNSFIPEIAFILKEDDHEIEKYFGKISDLLKRHNIPFQIKKKLNSDDYEKLKGIELDLIAVYGWRTILRTELNSYLKHGMIAAHQALLPKYRGFAPVQWAIINGEKTVGTTLFRIEEGEIDSGPVIAQKKRKVHDDEYWYDVDEKLIDDTISMFLNFFREKGKMKFTKQNSANATYTCKRTPGDGKIDWQNSSGKIYDLIRGIAPPLPGAFCKFEDRIFTIHKALPGPANKMNFVGRIPGRVLKIHDNGIEVLCGKGTLLITEWEEENSKLIMNPNKIVRSITATLK